MVAANGERERRLAAVKRLALAVEELKLLIRMGEEVRAFASFQEFERAVELAVALSKQSGGPRRALAEQSCPEWASSPPLKRGAGDFATGSRQADGEIPLGSPFA